MKVKNNSKTRPYHIGNMFIGPGQTKDGIPDAAEADLKGHEDLEIIGGAVIEEEKGMTKAQLQAALTEKGIEYPYTANKAELQALYDAA